MRILVVEDESESRILLARALERLNHEVVSVANGAEAWSVLEKNHISLVITDSIMPKMNGIELTRRIRAGRLRPYKYIILVTRKDARNELTEGVKAGADDLLFKPFNIGELDVRIRIAERVLKLENEREELNKKLSSAYVDMRTDLEAASRMQLSLLPESATRFSNLIFDWIFCPCSIVAGDIFSFFEIDKNHVGFYLLDVAGHGVSAAMISLTLNRFLSGLINQGGLRNHSKVDNPEHFATSPSFLVKKLNERFHSDDGLEYFTMVYGVFDVRDGKTKLVQAGYPSPIYQQRDGEVSMIGTGGFPIGMLPDVEHEEHEFYLHPGDRLFLYSNGITECLGKDTERFSIERLINLVRDWRTIPLKELMRGIEQKLSLWRGDSEFDDDVTLLAIERA